MVGGKKRKQEKKSPRKPMSTFVYKDKRRDRGKEIDAMIKHMDELSRHTDAALARAFKSLEELRKILERA